MVGYEFAGRVREIGGGVDDLAIGYRHEGSERL
jgi:hypothetical protein